MATYYVVFKGRVPVIYLSWHECSKQVLHYEGAVYKKYSTFATADAAYQAAMRAEQPAAAPLPPDLGPDVHVPAAPVPPDLGPYFHVPVAPPAAETGSDGKLCCSLKVLCISLAVFFFGLWVKMGISKQH